MEGKLNKNKDKGVETNNCNLQEQHGDESDGGDEAAGKAEKDEKSNSSDESSSEDEDEGVSTVHQPFTFYVSVASQ